MTYSPDIQPEQLRFARGELRVGVKALFWLDKDEVVQEYEERAWKMFVKRPK